MTLTLPCSTLLQLGRNKDTIWGVPQNQKIPNLEFCEMVGSCGSGHTTPDDEMVDHFSDGGFSESGRRCEWHGPLILPLIALNCRILSASNSSTDADFAQFTWCYVYSHGNRQMRLNVNTNLYYTM